MGDPEGGVGAPGDHFTLATDFAVVYEAARDPNHDDTMKERERADP